MGINNSRRGRKKKDTPSAGYFLLESEGVVRQSKDGSGQNGVDKSTRTGKREKKETSVQVEGV